MLVQRLWGEARRTGQLALSSPGDALNPLVFYLLIVSLFPMAVSPDGDQLAVLAPGVLWVAALLATLLASDGLFRRDYDDGSLEALIRGGAPLFASLLVRLVVQWLVTGLPLVILTPLVAVQLHLPVSVLPVMLITLLLGTPVLLLFGALAAAFTVALRRGGVLLSLLALPLYLPVMIFGAGAVAQAGQGMEVTGQLLWLAVMLVLALTFVPFAIAMALRIALQH